MNKPNCYECEFRQAISGDCHSECRHPVFEKLRQAGGGLLGLLSLIGGAGSIQTPHPMVGITVKGDPDGIRNGWFNHPFNFDPVWLLECSGFKQKEKKETEVG